jgi:curli biogenesis system outer membrane secretion channel CsgG
MKYVIAIALACLVACAVPSYAQEAAKPDAAAAKVDVSGVWDMSVETPNGPIENVATLKQEGEKLTGTLASQMGEIAMEGTVVGSEIKWVLNIDMGGQQMSIAFAGKVEGETMAGVFEMGGMGTAGWSAKKRKQ